MKMIPITANQRSRDDNGFQVNSIQPCGLKNKMNLKLDNLKYLVHNYILIIKNKNPNMYQIKKGDDFLTKFYNEFQVNSIQPSGLKN